MSGLGNYSGGFSSGLSGKEVPKWDFFSGGGMTAGKCAWECSVNWVKFGEISGVGEGLFGRKCLAGFSGDVRNTGERTYRHTHTHTHTDKQLPFYRLYY